jgi:hypothetical protein
MWWEWKWLIFGWMEERKSRSLNYVFVCVYIRRCIGPGRARTQIRFSSIPFNVYVFISCLFNDASIAHTFSCLWLRLRRDEWRVGWVLNNKLGRTEKKAMSVSTYETQHSQYPEHYNMKSNKAGFAIAQHSSSLLVYMLLFYFILWRTNSVNKDFV